ncbi:MAG: Na+/H+ antiporter NhaA [Porphyromonadaceae bacterium CG2_30_38_12]|nr:MAG: Na+/H+ antiporter NhaA [Porphyromonadaceae bacterium CG2_30_38_12]
MVRNIKKIIPTQLFKEFFDSEKAGGVILVYATLISLVIANSTWQQGYIQFWSTDLGGHSLVHWINDGLMTIFFLLIGLELEREIYKGELSNIKSASLPIISALGGMLVPAGLFLMLNFGTSTQQGAGIPMATDIAFAIGILSLLGNRVPLSLKVFLTALAVIDDLGAILVIAIFYTSSISYLNLFIALGIFSVLLLLNRLKVFSLIPYIIGGIAMWYFMLHSGVHATITGVLLAFAVPFGTGNDKSPSYVLQHFLHKPVAFFILPLFAIANTGIALGTDWANGLQEMNSLGIIAGLVIGKPLGIWLFAFVASALGICALPNDLKWKNILGAGLLAGIGFTMSIFITLLAFNDTNVVNNSKIAILVASVLAGITGFVFLRFTIKSPTK